MCKVVLCLMFVLLVECPQVKAAESTENPQAKRHAENPMTLSETSISLYFIDHLQDKTIVVEDVEGTNPFIISPAYGDAEGEMPDAEYQQVFVVIYIVITAIGLVANGIVFFVIFAGKETNKTVTALYVLQLAIADSIFLVMLPLFAAQKSDMNWAFGQNTCILCYTIRFVNYYAGILFLTAMSVDRYIAVVYSTKSRQLRTRTRTLLVCAIVWFAAVLMSMPVMLFAGTEKVDSQTFCRLMFPGYVPYNSSVLIFYGDTDDSYEDDSNSTLIDWELNAISESDVDLNATSSYDDQMQTLPDWQGGRSFICSHDNHSALYNGWLIVNFVIGFLVPFSIISISYILILNHLRLSEERVANLTVRKTASTRKKVTRLVAVLVICFVVCWLPFNIFNLLKIPGINISATRCFDAEQFLAALGFSNSAINPILYSFLGHSFRMRLTESIAATRRSFRRNLTLPSGGANGPATNQHNSEPSHHTFMRRLSNLVGLRRQEVMAPNSKGNERQASASSQSPVERKPQKHATILVEISKKKENWGNEKQARSQVLHQSDDRNCITKEEWIKADMTGHEPDDEEAPVLLHKETRT